MNEDVQRQKDREKQLQQRYDQLIREKEEIDKQLEQVTNQDNESAQ